MASDLGLYLTSINQTKENVMRNPEADASVVTGYPHFIINRLLSYHQDVVLIVNEINKLPHLDPQLKYEFLLYGLTKKKRFSKLAKAAVSEKIEILREYYNYSTEKALEIVDLHTEEDFRRMNAEMSEGGVLREKQSSKRHG
jgi:Bacteriophage clamp loader A subunit